MSTLINPGAKITPGPQQCRKRVIADRIGRIIAIGLILLGTLSIARANPPLIFPDKTARIALDPGHGGRDSGARGPTGLLEKDICMEIARKLALRFEPQYQVILTRSDDYQVELMQRTAIANEADADLLISLHTGASFVHSAQRISIYYHSDTARNMTFNERERPGEPGDLQQWERAQIRYQPASLALATTLKKYLDQAPNSPGCSIHAAPLAVLEGADMPAVLIEIGHITNPATEAGFGSPQEGQWLTKQIFNGIQAFLAQYNRSAKR